MEDSKILNKEVEIFFTDSDRDKTISKREGKLIKIAADFIEIINPDGRIEAIPSSRIIRIKAKQK